MVDLYGAKPGSSFALSLGGLSAQTATYFVAGVWRDYARQGGAIVMDSANFERLTGDTRINDIALWLAPGANANAVKELVLAGMLLAARNLAGAQRFVQGLDAAVHVTVD